MGDEVTSAIRSGITASQACVIFKKGMREIQDSLTRAGVTRIGKTSAGAFKYSLTDMCNVLAAPAKLDTEIIEHLMRTKADQLPDKLRKEYWSAKQAQQNFEREAGELWTSSQVIEYLGDTFKAVRMALQLLADTVERQEGLSEKQRKIVQEAVDTTLNDMRERLQNGFKNRRNSEKRRADGTFASKSKPDEQRKYAEEEYADL